MNYQYVNLNYFTTESLRALKVYWEVRAILDGPEATVAEIHKTTIEQCLESLENEGAIPWYFDDEDFVDAFYID
jgi:hypothetical protein